MPASSRVFALALAAAIAMSSLWGAPASARTLRPATLRTGDVADRAKQKRRIALLPIKTSPVSPDELFTAARGQVPSRPIGKLLSTALQSHDYVVALGPTDIKRALTRSGATRATRKVAQERYRLGVEYYMSMAFDRAAKSLALAAKLYRDVLQDLVDPKPLADAYLIAGVSLVQAGQTKAANDVLKQLFDVQPDRRFSRRGFYGPEVDKALLNALADHRKSARPELAHGDRARMHAVARSLQLDAIITAATATRDGRQVLYLSLYREDHRAFAARFSVDVSEIHEPGSDAIRAIEAWVARSVACLPIVERDPQPTRRKYRNIWMDTSGTAGAFLRRPTRLQFFSLGFAAGVEQQMRPGLSWHGRLNVLTSLADPYRDLVGSFNSLRGLLGVSFFTSLGRFRLFFRPGLEVHLLGSAVTTRDPDCKFFGLTHFKCDKRTKTTQNFEQDVLLGVNAAVGTQIAIGRDFFAALQASGTFYFLSQSESVALNLPVIGEIGLGYRF